MSTAWRRAAIAMASASVFLSLAACSHKVTASPTPSDRPNTNDGFAVGLALPEEQTARYEAVDRPTIAKKLKELCPKCTIDYQNATQNAALQEQQVDTLVNDGVKVIILDAVDYKAIQPAVEMAHSKGVKVVAYDRLAQGPIDAYTSFDNVQIGREQAEGLLQAMGSKATPDARIVMVDGDRGDPNAAQYKAGAHSILHGSVKIAAEYDTNGWLASEAQKEVASAIDRIGRQNIAAVYSANDGMAGGVISALQDAHISPLPPVSGQDAALDGAQRIIAGTQAFTIYKPYTVEAAAAAQMAVDLVTGQRMDVAGATVDSATTKHIPARLIATTVMDAKNIRQTIVDSGLYTVDQICTPAYADACARIGLK